MQWGAVFGTALGLALFNERDRLHELTVGGVVGLALVGLLLAWCLREPRQLPGEEHLARTSRFDLANR